MRISRSHSASLADVEPSGWPEAPGVRYAAHADTVRHDAMAGLLMRASSSPGAWRTVRCDKDSLIDKVEFHRGRGIFTIVAAEERPPHVRGRQQDIQHAIASAIPMSGPVAVTLHLNHRNGSTQAENEADIDYYHTLGLPMQSGGRANHYHLEFPDRLDVSTLLEILGALAMRTIGDRPVLSGQDMERILGLMGHSAGTTREGRPWREPERDALQRKYLALGEMNLRQAMARRGDLRSPRTGFVNARDQPARRAVEPSCMKPGMEPGKTQDAVTLRLASDLQRLEELARQPTGVIELMNMRHGLRLTMRKFPGEASLRRAVLAAIERVELALAGSVADRARGIVGS